MSVRTAKSKCALAAGAAVLAFAACAHAWDAQGHRTITFLALDGLAKLAPDRPDFLGTAENREMAAYQAAEPDRYRAVRSTHLKHENDPDHYIDVEDLARFGLTLDTLPRLRYEYLRAMAVAKHEHPPEPVEGQAPYNEKTDFARTQEWPGYAPYAVMEHHAKLISAFKTYRTLAQVAKTGQASTGKGGNAEAGGGAEPERTEMHLAASQRDAQMTMARANILAEMGLLAHFVGDLAQPLHTTQHHHGWVGPNPHGYSTDKGIHAYIDGKILKVHVLRYATLRDQATFTRAVDERDPWNDVIAHIRRSHDKVEPLYLLMKAGDMEKEAGKSFIAERLLDGGSMLAALYADAWRASALTNDDASMYVKYDGSEAETGAPVPAK